MRLIVIAAVAVVGSCGAAFGDAYHARREVAFGIGYTHLFWDGHNTDEMEDRGGARMEARFSVPLSTHPHVRLGAGFGLTSYISEHGGDSFEEDGILYIRPDDWVQLTTLEPEIQLSVRHPLNDDFYVEPGIAGVFIAGNYRRGEEVFGYVDEDLDRWRVGAGGRLFLRGAYVRGRHSYGLEGSYSYGWLDFGDDVGGDIQQGYLGFFYAYRL